MKFFRKRSREFSLALVFAFVAQLIPNTSVANVTNEQSSSPAGGGGNLVNMYNGALNYSIPLLTVPGSGISYDITLNYNSDKAKMQETASCVGFGWDLNIGQVVRQVQSIPDDFNGDVIKTRNHIKEYVKREIGLGELSGKEYAGLPINVPEKKIKADKLVPSFSGSLYTDNYSGAGLRIKTRVANLELSESSSLSGDIEFDTKRGIGFDLGLNYGFLSTQASLNSISGVNSLSIGVAQNNGYSYNSVLYQNSFVSGVNMEMKTDVYTGKLKLGFGLETLKLSGSYNPLLMKSTIGGEFGSYRYNEVRSSVKYPNKSLKGYGYLYKENYPDDDNKSLNDFIRYEIPYHQGTEYLTPSQIGTDIFTQIDQGSGGTFTLRSNTVEAWGKSTLESETIIHDIGGEYTQTSAGPGAGLQAGVDYRKYRTNSRSGVNSGLINDLGLNHFSSDQNLNFVKANEVHIEETDNQLSKWKGIEPVRFDVNRKNAFNFKAEKRILNSKDDNTRNISPGAQKSFKKNSYTQYLTFNELKEFGRTKNFGFIKTIDGQDYLFNHPDHIGEINVYDNNGLIYSYAEPVVNSTKVDAMFSLSFEDGGNLEGLELNQLYKSIPANNINGYNVVQGKSKSVAGNEALHHGQELLRYTQTPEHVTSWLVSMITSNGYYDLTGNGPSNDDPGSWVKFEYLQTHSDFAWRSPYEGISTVDNNLGESGDDLGSYRYGEKTVKYIKRIETKTHMAVFEYEDREDGFPVLKEPSENNPNGSFNGGIDLNGSPLKRLIKISLFVKKNNQNNTNSLELVKEVSLEQNYELVKGEPSNKNNYPIEQFANTGGKLTLNSLYFSYYDSNRSNDYKYEFSYGNNVDFNLLNIDRWGEYKNNEPYEESNYMYTSFLYPELNHTPEEAPWRLVSILKPGGSKIDIEYERREYAFDQNKAATSCYDIASVLGVTDDQTLKMNLDRLRVGEGESLSDKLIHENLIKSDRDNIIIKLPNNEFHELEAKGENLNRVFYENYLEGIEEEIYIQAYVNLDSDLGFFKGKERNFEKVELMCRLAKIDDNYLYGVFKSNNQFYATIRLAKVFPVIRPVNNPLLSADCYFKAGAIRSAAINHIIEERQEMFFGELGDASVVNPKVWFDMLESFFSGVSCGLFRDRYASSIRLNGWSKIRLKNGTQNKIGGGYRVKTITLNDNWDNDPTSYRMKYKYELEEKNTITGEPLSSGVAVEPMQGKEESAHYRIEYYKEKQFLGENKIRRIKGNPLFVHTPSPSVGYSRITVENDYDIFTSAENPSSNLDLEDFDLSQAPKIVYEFYSYKEFPVVYQKTEISPQYGVKRAPIPSVSGLMSMSRSRNMLSQGFSIVKTDMPGKLKSITELTRGSEEIISKQEYIYDEDKISWSEEGYQKSYKKMKGTNSYTANIPNNDLLTLNSGIDDHENKFRVEEKSIGLDYEIWVDINKDDEQTAPVGFGGMLNVMWNPPFPAVSPLVGYPLNVTDNLNEQIVLNKVIHKKGVLKKVITIKNQSEIESEYLYYDQETAAPILTKVDNEWKNTNAQDEAQSTNIDEPVIYKLSRPAYWEYDYRINDNIVSNPFRGAYETMDKTFNNLTVSNSYLNVTDNSLVDGDMVTYELSSNPGVYHYGFIEAERVSASSNDLRYRLWNFDHDDVILETLNFIRVIKSGNSNMIGATLGELVFKKFIENQSTNIFSFDQVLNTSAMTYTGDWPTPCCLGSEALALNNPYINGSRNHWRPYQSYVYHGTRDYSNPSYSQRGLISNYDDFNWLNLNLNSANWVLSSTAIRYDLWGHLLESSNALNLSSSSIYGYGNTRVVSTTSLSSSEESLVDDFEQKNYDNCGNTGNSGITEAVEDNENGQNGSIEITNDRAHTGRNSLEVGPLQRFRIIKTIECEED